MDKNLTLRVAAVAGILTAGLIVSFYWPAGRTSAPEIVLPQTGSADIDMDDSREQYNRRIVNEIAVDSSSVQCVVATLRRPEQYTLTGESTFYYGDQTKAISIQCAVRGGLTKVIQSVTTGLYKHTLLTPSDAYIWSSDTQSYYKGVLGDFSVDDLALIPTYEKLISLPEDEIEKGGFEEIGGMACIYAERRKGETDVRECYYISVETGLLTAYQSYEGEKLTYAVHMVPALETVGDEWFTLPSGVVVTDADQSPA